jgi:hypothetical protein
LLRDFFESRSPSAARLWATPKAPMSAVIFSLSTISAGGRWAIDFRDLGCVAGNVTSSLEDIVAKTPKLFSPDPVALDHALLGYVVYNVTSPLGDGCQQNKRASLDPNREVA